MRTLLVEESVYVIFDESIVPSLLNDHVDEDTLKPRFDNFSMEENKKVRCSLPRK